MGIINHCGIVDDRNIVSGLHIVVMDVPSAKILVSHESPLIVWDIIARAISNVDADTRTYWRPPIII